MTDGVCLRLSPTWTTTDIRFLHEHAGLGAAELTVAVLYGLALQVQAEPEIVMGSIFDLREGFVLQYLRREA